MAKYKQVEFARLCGINKSSMPAYVQRKKVIVEDGLVDDTNPVNQAFLLKFQEKQKLNNPVATEHVQSDTDEKSTALEPTLKEQKVKGKQQKGSSYHELELQKKALDIEKTQQEIELLEKRNMKMDGESIPTDIVKSIFSYYGKNITTSFHNAAENWLTKIARIKGLSNTELAEMRGDLAKGINEGVLKAQEESKKAIASIIKEYSLKREVGEHD